MEIDKALAHLQDKGFRRQNAFIMETPRPSPCPVPKSTAALAADTFIAEDTLVDDAEDTLLDDNDESQSQVSIVTVSSNTESMDWPDAQPWGRVDDE